jgi:hypothetical protein
MGALFSGTYRADNDRPPVEIEAVREHNSERWRVIAHCGGARCEAYTDAPDPTPTIWRLVGEALDAKAEAVPSQWDMNKRVNRATTPTTAQRRRGKFPPGSVPEWRPPETD